LYYYGARYYDARKSVWLSVDPLAEIYPETSAYMYCAGNPVKLVDPDGCGYELNEGTGEYWWNPNLHNQEDAAEGFTYMGETEEEREQFIRERYGERVEVRRSEQTSGMIIFGINSREDKSVDDRAKYQDNSVDGSNMNGLSGSRSFLQVAYRFLNWIFPNKDKHTKIQPVIHPEEEKKEDLKRTKVRTEHLPKEEGKRHQGNVIFYEVEDTLDIYETRLNGELIGRDSVWRRSNKGK